MKRSTILLFIGVITIIILFISVVTIVDTVSDIFPPYEEPINVFWMSLGGIIGAILFYGIYKSDKEMGAKDV